MKKTKIICSIGPASSSVEVMEKLVLNGVNIKSNTHGIIILKAPEIDQTSPLNPSSFS